MSDPWVLVTEGGSGQSRAAVAAVRALAVGGYRAAVTVLDGVSLAGASRYCSRRVPVPSASDTPARYERAVHEELARRAYLCVFPATDAALLALRTPARLLMNKVECAEAARAAGFAIPTGAVFPSAAAMADAAATFSYPVVVKPDFKSTAAQRADSPAELLAAAGVLQTHTGTILVQRYVPDAQHGVIGLAWRGRLVEVAHMHYERLWPAPCGTAAVAQTVDPDRELEARLERLLGDYSGPFEADLAGPYLLDLNPRVHAMLALALAAGLNPVATYCRLVQGESSVVRRAKPGLRYRWVEGDVRSVLRAVRERRMGLRAAFAALRPRGGTTHPYESIADPGPMLARARFAARRLLHGPLPPVATPVPAG